MPVRISRSRDTALICLRGRHSHWQESGNASDENERPNLLSHHAISREITCGQQPLSQIWSQRAEILATFRANGRRLPSHPIP